MESPIGPLFLMLLVVMCFAYFIPAFVAWARAHHLFWTIFALNFFLGWSVIGRVVALAMAVGPALCAHGPGVLSDSSSGKAVASGSLASRQR